VQKSWGQIRAPDPEGAKTSGSGSALTQRIAATAFRCQKARVGPERGVTGPPGEAKRGSEMITRRRLKIGIRHDFQGSFLLAAAFVYRRCRGLLGPAEQDECGGNEPEEAQEQQNEHRSFHSTMLRARSMAQKAHSYYRGTLSKSDHRGKVPPAAKMEIENIVRRRGPGRPEAALVSGPLV
jgi:hypothetical protein